MCFSKMINMQHLNIFLLSVGFMFIFFAFQPMMNIGKVMHIAIQKDIPEFTADGFYVSAIIFGAFSISNWFTPSIMVMTGPKIALIGGCILVILHVSSYFHPENALVYTTACFCGLGVSLLWTSSGVILTLTSTENTIIINSGVFWAITHFSIVMGNLFIFIELKDVTVIDRKTRTIIYTTFALVACAGIPLFFGLHTGLHDSFTNYVAVQTTPYSALKTSFKLLKTRNILLLSLTFSYCGFVLTFLSGILETAVGFTLRFHSKAKQMMGLAGLFVSVGEVFGAILMGISGWRMTKFGRSAVIFGAMSAHLVAYLLIFLTLPHDSTSGENFNPPIIPPSRVLVSFSAFLLGTGDAIYNTQTICVISIIFCDDCSSAYALFKFFQSFFAAISFIYAAHIGLYYQLSILIVFSIVGTICFYILDDVSENKLKALHSRINTSVESVDFENSV